MTTIAWDGKRLVGDRLSSLFRGSVQKVFRLSDGRLFGSSGAIQDGVAVRRWLEAGGDKPKVDENFHAILITPNYGEPTIDVYENALVPMVHARPYMAVGSGRDFAMAAMYLGKSAEQAVALAAEFDCGTGLHIDSLTIDEPAHTTTIDADSEFIRSSGESLTLDHVHKLIAEARMKLIDDIKRGRLVV